MKFGHQANC